MTSIKPAKLLIGTFTLDPSTPTVDYWYTSSAEDPTYGQPYRWNAVLNVSQQSHSNANTPQPFVYNGLDIKVGDWMTDLTDGKSVKIISITSATTDVVNVVVEDTDMYNFLHSDINISPLGIGTEGDMIVFELNTNGLPILGPARTFNTVLNYNPTFFSDVINRFVHRNIKQEYVKVYQENHTFDVGDIIYISDSGTYDKIAANSANKANLERIVGHVLESNVPGIGYFSFKPRGTIVENISPILPGSAGSVIYLDPDQPGKLTATKPSKFPIPIYIQLDSPTRGLLVSGGGGGASSGPLGYNASVYKMGTIAERDAIDVEQLQVGDLVYVADTGVGEWAMFMWAGVIGVTPTWYTLADYDSSTTDAKTKTVELFYSQNQPLNIWSIGETARVVDITVEVVQTFHTTATLAIGDDSVNNRLMDSDDVDLSVPGKYSVSPSYQYGGTGEPLIKAYYNPGFSTQGEAKITLTYV